MSFFEKHKKGIFGTIIFHTIVLLMLVFLGFFTPLPLPGEEGILVQFGTSEQGLGQQEPASAPSEPAPVEPVDQEEQEPVPPPPASPPPQPSEPPQEAEEEAMTQDFEETAAIDAAEKRRQEEEERQRQLEEERRRQEELEQQRQEEAERRRQEELERQRREEALRKQREEEQRRINEINEKAQSAFGGDSQGAEGQGSGENESQGKTFPGGNQGVPTGDPDANTYGPGGSGSGDQGSGISYSLAGRTPKALPKPQYPGNDEGIVVVNITVDKYGNVTSAEAGARGTTIMESHFFNEARKAALKAKFNVDEDAPAFQQGTISYRFSLK